MSSRPAGLLTRGDAVGLVLLLLTALAFRPLQTYSLVLALVMVYAITAGSLVLLFGVAGQLSLGHAIFVGVGAFVSANVTDRTAFGLEIELPLAFLITFGLGLVVGLPAIRVRELYLALATFALAFAGQKGLFEFRWFTGGGAGRRSGPLTIFGIDLASRLALVWVCFGTMLVSFWLLRNLIRARTGRAMHAVRTSETAAAAVGIDVGRFKVLAFGFSAAFAGMAGVLYIHTIRFVNPENFGVDFSILLILTLIIGGKHRLAGAVAGAIFVQGVPEAFRSIQDWEGMIYGATLLALTLWSPGGLIGIVELAVAPIRRTLLRGGDADRHVPSADGSIDTEGITAGDATQPGDPAPTHPTPAAAGTPMGRLVLSDISVHFGGVMAVDHVSLTVEPGTVVGLIGSNGAGKTTLFNAATGIVRATGAVHLDGVDLGALPPRRRAAAGLGRTFQNLNLHEGLTTIDHVLIGLHQRARYATASELVRLPHVTRKERELWDAGHELLERLGLDHVAAERVDDLPYGLQKRVDVARALATGPRILMLDEPAAGLPGIEAIETIARVLAVARERGAATLIIEHNVELVAEVCDHIVVMDAGRVLRAGLPAEVISDQSVIDAYLGSDV